MTEGRAGCDGHNSDEPLGSHVLELEIAAVVTETEDARSLVFTVPMALRYRRSGCATPPASS